MSSNPGCDEIQQPVYPDLLNATVRYGTYVGKVQLLVPTKVVLVSLVVRQWGAEAGAPPEGQQRPQRAGCVHTHQVR